MRRLLCLSLWLLTVFAVPAWSQSSSTAPPVSIDILVLPSSGDPLTIPPVATRTSSVSQASADCNLAAPPPAPTPLVNPDWAYFDDPFNAGRKCRARIPSGIADGIGYRAVGVFTAAGTCEDGNGVPLNPCASVRSSVGVPPFNIQPILTRPAAPTNLVVSP